MTLVNPNPALYRPCVGIALFNRRGEVLMGERIPKKGEVLTHTWQMPQGGIDEGEDLETAAFREMAEEIGTENARILDIMKDWIYYDIPTVMALKLWTGKYKGQRQKWVALEFLGEDSDIRLDQHSHPEFSQWAWTPMGQILEKAVPFKRDVYTKVIERFTPISQKLASASK